jgi:hypothetical protein
MVLTPPYGGGGVPGGVTLGESTSQVLPVFTRLGPHDRSNIDSDAIKRLEAGRKSNISYSNVNLTAKSNVHSNLVK